jgi:hypothetical protein
LASSRKKPGKAPRKAAQRRPEEHGEKCLHMHCQQWLERSGLWGRLLIFHVANERRGGIGTIMHFKRMGVRPGVADYLAFVPGRSIAIELKDEDGPQDAEQEKFQRKWEAAGNVYILVRSLEQFQGAVQAIALFV